MMETSEMTSERRGNPWRIAIWTTIGALLLLPLVAMQFTPEVYWTGFDFAFAAIVLGGIGGAYELATRMSTSSTYRAGAALALIAVLLLIWFNGAVGIIGSENEDANLLFGGVILIALVGAIAARFRAAGMTRAMVAAAVAQILVPIVASVAALAPASMVWAREVFVLTGFFFVVWIASAALFREAASR